MASRPSGCRLLYLVGQLGPGGLERQLYYLLHAMDRARYRPEVAVWNFSESDFYVQHVRALGVPLHACAGSSPAARMRAIRRLVRRIRPEVVHSYTFFTNVAAWWAARGCATIPVGSIRNNFTYERRETGSILGRLSGRWPALQICNSEAASKASRRSRSPFKAAQLRVVRNGLDLQRFQYSPELPQRPTLLAVGRLCAEKRWDRVLRVIASVAGNGVRFRVLHAGDGPLRERLEAEARRLRVEQLIEFLGVREDIGALLSQSTALIHTADDEGCPNVVMEAMACGRAVVATDAGDVPLLVDDGSTGFVVRRGDDRTLIERTTMLLQNEELCRRMGAAARSRAEREFGLGRLVSETLRAYRAAGWRES